MPENRDILIRSNERMFLCGKTGSGKTFAAKYILKPFNRLVVLDVKDQLQDWNLAPWDREARRLLKSGQPIRTRVVVPIGKDPAEVWDGIFEDVLSSGNCHLYIDEMYGVVPPNTQASPLLWAVITRGRSMGIGTTSASQRPAWVPLVALSESEHFFVFRLTLDEDRKRMSNFMGPAVLGTIGDKHGVYYSYATWDAPLYMERLPLGPGPRSAAGASNKGGK
jgi:DNA helicase HerA-like ATPase